MSAVRRDVLLFSATGGLGALLLFWVQPMFAKVMLPILGGSAAVWLTLMFFYQLLLLGGYIYAHALSHWVPRPGQLVIHALLVAAGVLGVFWQPALTAPPQGSPVWWLLDTALRQVGLPFFLLATTAPLTQHWFSQRPHPRRHDPYFLYALSNIGSFTGLLAYPLVLEYWLPLQAHLTLWRCGLALYAPLVLACQWLAWHGHRHATSPALATAEVPPTTGGHAPLTGKLMGRWLVLALVPSSLLLGVTHFITSEVAAVPLLWVVPLALYLLTWSLAFSATPLCRLKRLALLVPVMLAGVVLLSLTYQIGSPLALLWHLLTFFILALTLHSELAAQRPHTRHLTLFYMVLALGGALGGLFNSILAPLLFSGMYEYPLMLAVAGILLWRHNRHWIKAPYDSVRLGRITGWALDGFIPLAILLALIVSGLNTLVLPNGTTIHLNQTFSTVAIWGITLLALGTSLHRPARMGLITAAALGGQILILSLSSDHILSVRSFYGAYQVRFDTKRLAIDLWTSATTAKQGSQSMVDAHKTDTLYFYPLEGVKTELNPAVYSHPWAAIGLGAGTMACLPPKGTTMTFFELDPTITWIARDSSYFSYLQDCPAHSTVINGDGRRQLALNIPDNSLGLLAIDAFNGASLPTHMLTQEAMSLYLRKLVPGGVLLLNITNPRLNLLAEVTAQAAAHHLVGRQRGPVPDRRSHFVILARTTQDLGKLATDTRWQALPAHTTVRAWTDQRTNMLPLLRF